MGHDLTPSREEIAVVIEGAREAFAKIAARTPTGFPLSFEREASFAIQILAGNDFLASIAMRCPESLTAAVSNVAAIGLSLNPILKHAYLVPRKTRQGWRVCLDTGAQGFVDLARRGGLRDVFFNLVRENDAFKIPTSPGEKVSHDFDPFATKDERGKVRGVYAQHVYPDGYVGQCATLSRSQIVERMECSEGWKAHHRPASGKEPARSCIWCDWPDEQTLKTVLRYARRWWPQTPELDRALATLDAQGDGVNTEAEDSIETTGVWIGEEPPAGEYASEPVAAPVPADPARIAALRAAIENAGSPINQKTGEPRLLEIVIDNFGIKTLSDLPASKLAEAEQRVAAYAAKKQAKAAA